MDNSLVEDSVALHFRFYTFLTVYFIFFFVFYSIFIVFLAIVLIFLTILSSSFFIEVLVFLIFYSSFFFIITAVLKTFFWPFLLAFLFTSFQKLAIVFWFRETFFLLMYIYYLFYFLIFDHYSYKYSKDIVFLIILTIGKTNTSKKTIYWY